MTKRFTMGIDEAGRGPLAGPLSLGICIIRRPRALRALHKLLSDPKRTGFFKDSKMFNQQGRELAYHTIMHHVKNGSIDISYTQITPSYIDTHGMSKSLARGVRTLLQRIHKKYALDASMSRVHLDGKLYAPQKYIHQETLIKGDTRRIEIAVASIIAKVSRDRHMKKLAKQYPQYGFDAHKGYGTKKHYEALKKYGPSEVHRRSFLKE